MRKSIYNDRSRRFYVYAFLRKTDLTCTIISERGSGDRAWVKKGRCVRRPAEDCRIVILQYDSLESDAFNEEIRLIKFYGRIDLGTGILRNRADGGEWSSGYKHSAEAIAKLSGVNNPNFGKKASAETITKMRAAKAGKNHPSFGKKRSPATIAKMIETRRKNKEAQDERG